MNQKFYDFIRFLKNENAYSQYRQNVSPKSISRYKLYEQVGMTALLYCTFTWKDTPQGFKFWEKLAKKIQKQYE